MKYSQIQIFCCTSSHYSSFWHFFWHTSEVIWSASRIFFLSQYLLYWLCLFFSWTPSNLTRSGGSWFDWFLIWRCTYSLLLIGRLAVEREWLVVISRLQLLLYRLLLWCFEGTYACSARYTIFKEWFLLTTKGRLWVVSWEQLHRLGLFTYCFLNSFFLLFMLIDVNLLNLWNDLRASLSGFASRKHIKWLA